MSAEVTLVCDSCAGIIDAGTPGHSATAVRTRSRAEGTSHGRAPRDICTACWKQGGR